jgi:uncharacterized protein (TIGR02217 family)
MAFYEVRFPTDISYGSSGGPGFATTIIGLDGGSEQRVSRWSNARRTFNVAYGIKSYAQLQSVIKHYIAVKGAANGFRYKDWGEFTTAADGQSAFAADDEILHTVTEAEETAGTCTVQYKKKYKVTQGASETQTVTRNIAKPVLNQVKIAKKASGDISPVELGAGWTVNYTTGIVSLSNSGSYTMAEGDVIYGGCEFDVPVRFSKEIDTMLSVSLDTFDTGSAESIELVELIEPSEFHDEVFHGGAAYIQFSVNTTVGQSQGRLIVGKATAGSLTMTMPNSNNLPPGGPHFVVFNAGTNAFTVSGSDGLSFSLAADKAVELFVDASNDWKAWQSEF